MFTCSAQGAIIVSGRSSIKRRVALWRLSGASERVEAPERGLGILAAWRCTIHSSTKQPASASASRKTAG